MQDQLSSTTNFLSQKKIKKITKITISFYHQKNIITKITISSYHQKNNMN